VLLLLLLPLIPTARLPTGHHMAIGIRGCLSVICLTGGLFIIAPQTHSESFTLLWLGMTLRPWTPKSEGYFTARARFLHQIIQETGTYNIHAQEPSSVQEFTQ
jgi:hypothetical protein